METHLDTGILINYSSVEDHSDSVDAICQVSSCENALIGRKFWESSEECSSSMVVRGTGFGYDLDDHGIIHRSPPTACHSLQIAHKWRRNVFEDFARERTEK
jgi:hypothetical protein